MAGLALFEVSLWGKFPKDWLLEECMSEGGGGVDCWSGSSEGNLKVSDAEKIFKGRNKSKREKGKMKSALIGSLSKP